jgi:urease accessory protein
VASLIFDGDKDMTLFRKHLIPAGAVAAILLAPAIAMAHTGAVGHGSGIASGLIHPLFGLDHLLAMVAVGLWAAQQPRSGWLLPAGFVLGMMLGALLGLQGVAFAAAEPGIAGSVLVLGAAVLAGRHLPSALAVAATAVFGMFHGYAHGAEMPATAAPLMYGAGFVLTTILLHASGLVGGRMLLASAAPMLLRLAGAAVAVSGAVLLAA